MLTLARMGCAHRNDFPMQHRRELVTEEPEPSGSRHDPRHQDVEWIGHQEQGGGWVAPDYLWRSNPRHDRLLPGERGN